MWGPHNGCSTTSRYVRSSVVVGNSNRARSHRASNAAGIDNDPLSRSRRTRRSFLPSPCWWMIGTGCNVERCPEYRDIPVNSQDEIKRANPDQPMDCLFLSISQGHGRRRATMAASREGELDAGQPGLITLPGQIPRNEHIKGTITNGYVILERLGRHCGGRC
jgi:hypothetical protein